jgi:hypothetical protein
MKIHWCRASFPVGSGHPVVVWWGCVLMAAVVQAIPPTTPWTNLAGIPPGDPVLNQKSAEEADAFMAALGPVAAVSTPAVRDLVGLSPTTRDRALQTLRAEMIDTVDNPVPNINNTTIINNSNDPYAHDQRRQLIDDYQEIFNVDGIANLPLVPPDTVGDVGPLHYVQMTNSPGGSRVRILIKSTGMLARSEFDVDELAPAGNDCANGLGDPIVLFDQYANRWLLTEFGQPEAKVLCVYVSKTDDPLGEYHFYRFSTPNFPDYPKYGVWPDAYYVGTNEGGAAVPVYAMERAKMLNGQPAGFLRQGTTIPKLSGFGLQLIVPVDGDGETLPPTNAPGIFVRHVDDESHSVNPNTPTTDKLELWHVTVDFAAMTITATLAQTILVKDFDSNLCGLTSFDCVPQPGTTQKLHPLREPVMNRPLYRNFGTHESIVLTWVTDITPGVIPDRHGIRWTELRRTGGSSSTWSVFQQADHSPDAVNRWMGSMAMNGRGDIALGYSVSDSFNVFPGIRYVGRRVSDPVNTLPLSEVTAKAGLSSQPINRYGDYSAMSVDPVDDETFWFTTEYIGLNGRWQTRIVAFKIIASQQPSARPSVKPSAQPSMKPSARPSMKPSVKPSVRPSMKPSQSRDRKCGNFFLAILSLLLKIVTLGLVKLCDI